MKKLFAFLLALGILLSGGVTASLGTTVTYFDIPDVESDGSN